MCCCSHQSRSAVVVGCDSSLNCGYTDCLLLQYLEPAFVLAALDGNHGRRAEDERWCPGLNSSAFHSLTSIIMLVAGMFLGGWIVGFAAACKWAYCTWYCMYFFRCIDHDLFLLY